MSKSTTENPAYLDDAPFPEKTAVPTANVVLEEADNQFSAFGSVHTAAPVGVEDSTIDDPSGHPVPVTYREAAEAVGNGDAGNEFDNSAIAEWHAANSTSAESLTIVPGERENSLHEESTRSEEVEESTHSEEAVAQKRRGRRSRAQIEADNAAAEAAAAAKTEASAE